MLSPFVTLNSFTHTLLHSLTPYYIHSHLITHHRDNVTAPHGRPNLRSRLHCCHAQEGGPRSPQGHVVVALDQKKVWLLTAELSSVSCFVTALLFSAFHVTIHKILQSTKRTFRINSFLRFFLIEVIISSEASTTDGQSVVPGTACNLH